MSFESLSARLPEWGRLFDAPAHAAFLDAVRAQLQARGEPFELHDDCARTGGSWALPLLRLAERCSGVEAAEWPARVREELDHRAAAEKLGRELDAVRGDFTKALPFLKLRVQRASSLGAGAICAPIAGELQAVLVLDLPSFVTPVRVADLAAWERPAEKLVRLALENVKGQEDGGRNPMENAGTEGERVSGESGVVASLGVGAGELRR